MRTTVGNVHADLATLRALTELPLTRVIRGLRVVCMKTTKHWIVRKYIDRGPGQLYRYAIVEGTNLYTGEEICWHVPSFDNDEYDLSAAVGMFQVSLDAAIEIEWTINP